MSDTSPITRFTLERLLAGELPDAEAARVRAAVAAEPRLAHQLAALEADTQAFRAEVPYAGFRIEHERRAQARTQKRAGGWLRWLAAPSLAVAMGAASLWLVGIKPEATGPSDGATIESTRSKGASVGLSYGVREGSTARPGIPGERLGAGAVVQLRYDAGAYSHMAVLTVTASGEVGVLYPVAGQVMASPPAGPAAALPFSLKLDGEPGAERFVAVYGNGPLSLDPVRAALAEAGPAAKALELPAGYAQAWVVLAKE